MMAKIDKIHDRFFKKVFSDVTNIRDFLAFVLPEPLRKELDLNKLELDPNSYVSQKYKESLSDIVAKSRTANEDFPVDIYFLFEHKSHQYKRIFSQLLRFMHLM